MNSEITPVCFMAGGFKQRSLATTQCVCTYLQSTHESKVKLRTVLTTTDKVGRCSTCVIDMSGHSRRRLRHLSASIVPSATKIATNAAATAVPAIAAASMCALPPARNAQNARNTRNAWTPDTFVTRRILRCPHNRRTWHICWSSENLRNVLDNHPTLVQFSRTSATYT